MQSFMTEALKDNLNLRLGYVTGIFRTAQASIFSLLNNLHVFTVTSKKFSQYFGFTDSEIRELAETYDIKDKIDEIRAWYNGYKFGNTEIYNPWSILEYFSNDFEPEPFWINTADNSLIYELIRNAELYDNKNIINFLTGKPVRSSIAESIIYDNLKIDDKSLWTFLLSAGYLKPVEDYDKSNKNKIYSLIPPNKEVKDDINSLFSDKIHNLKGANELINSLQFLTSGDVINFQKTINKSISSMLSVRDYHEYFYHALVTAMVWFLKDRFDIKSQTESGDGYPDLVLIPKNVNDSNGLIIEIKRISDPYNSKNILDHEEELKKEVCTYFKAAFAQIINQKYQTILLEKKSVKKILKYALVFCKKECFALLQVDDEQILKNGDGSKISLVNLDKF
jgi:hypothetical protein